MSVFTNPAARAPGQAQAYIGALLSLLAERDPLEVLGETPVSLAGLYKQFPGDTVHRPEAPGKWSAKEVVQHLADSELVWGYRLRMVLAQERPPLTGYDQDVWARRLGYSEVNPQEALDQFTVLRRANLRLLGRATATDLARVGVHSERGEENLDFMRRLYAGHDLVHLRQLRRIHGAVAVG